MVYIYICIYSIHTYIIFIYNDYLYLTVFLSALSLKKPRVHKTSIIIFNVRRIPFFTYTGCPTAIGMRRAISPVIVEIVEFIKRLVAELQTFIVLWFSKQKKKFTKLIGFFYAFCKIRKQSFYRD